MAAARGWCMNGSNQAGENLVVALYIKALKVVKPEYRLTFPNCLLSQRSISQNIFLGIS